MIKKLSWDSNFWGIDIYDYNSINDYNTVDLSLDGSRAGYIIQSLVDTTNLKSIRHLENNNFHFIQNKLTFEKEISSNDSFKNNHVRKITLKDIVGKVQHIPQMFMKHSRYNMLNEELVNKFYYTWIEKSIKGSFDDGCFGYFHEQNLAGFITYKVYKKELQIGLFGVFPAYQSRGISQYLLTFIENFASEKNCSYISVSTQGINYNAINSYTKNDFKLVNISSWYYKESIL